MQFGLGAVLQYSNTPSLRVAGSEDEDDDEDENEAPCELRRPGTQRTRRSEVRLSQYLKVCGLSVSVMSAFFIRVYWLPFVVRFGAIRHGKEIRLL